MTDMIQKNRSQHGERHHHAKLSEKIVREIRRRHAQGEPRSSIAHRFGIIPGHATKIISRKAWRHVL